MPKPTAIDLLLISRYDSIYTYPVKMKDEFKKAQKGLTDSTEFYKLDLFVGLCFYLQGNADSALYLNQKFWTSATVIPELPPQSQCMEPSLHTTARSEPKRFFHCFLHHAYNAVYQSDDRRELQSICINLETLIARQVICHKPPKLQKGSLGSRFARINEYKIQYILRIGTNLC